MPIAPFESIVLKKVGETGTDGTTDNDNRTLPVYIGGQNFTIILVDSDASVQNNVKVQVNNSNPIDPTKKEHYISPKDLAIASRTSVLVDSGAWGGNNDQTKESSASAADFNSNWLDLTDATIDNTDLYVGSGAWRYIRLVHASSDINTTLSAYVYARDFSTNF